MFSSIENLKIISTFRRQNKMRFKIKSRNTHSFFIRLSGTMIYDFGDKKLTSPKNTLVFIPQGSSYSGEALEEGTSYMAIHFEGDFKEPPTPACYPLDAFYDAEYITSCFADLWNFGDEAERYQCLSLFYKLLSYVCATEHASFPEKAKFKIIEPAVKHLTEHIYDPALSVDKLHRLCGISNTYFRRIFVTRFGTTPQNYIVSKRISHARAIIKSGDYSTINEVAALVGFTDPLYFSKVFKKAYSVSPSEINKE